MMESMLPDFCYVKILVMSGWPVAQPDAAHCFSMTSKEQSLVFVGFSILVFKDLMF